MKNRIAGRSEFTGPRRQRRKSSLPSSNPRQKPGWRKYAGRWELAKLLFTTAAADRWKKKYGGLGVSELRKLRQLEPGRRAEENH